MLRLAESTFARGSTVAVTTTTRIRPPGDMPMLCTESDDGWTARLADLAGRSPVCVGRGINDAGKVEGVSIDALCNLALWPVDILLVEADGSAGRPIKVHADYEPVVPPCATHLLIVAGLDAMNRPVDGEIVHRMSEIERVGLERGELVDTEVMTRVLEAMFPYAPPGSDVTVVLNKADDEERVRAGQEIGLLLHRARPDVRVMITRWAAPVS